MSFNYLTLGNDCSPAAALRSLNLRVFALPFDWVVCNTSILESCFASNFEHFHKNLMFNINKNRLIDYYGIQFPHDYPLSDMNNIENETIGEGVIGEETGKIITDNWIKYYDVVLEKYSRRIERFKTIVSDTKPIIVLSRYSTMEVFELQRLFMKYYKIDNIYFVNSSNEMFENDKIKNIYTEQNNEWNDASIWKEGIDAVIKKYNDNISIQNLG
jgi:hypothetical protein